MTNQDILETIEEAKRFISRASILIECTESAEALKSKGITLWNNKERYRKYGMDAGNSEWYPSRVRGALKRSAIDLRQSLIKINKRDS